MLKGLLKQLLKLVNNLLSQIKAIYKKHKMLSLALGAFLLYYVLNNVEGFATEMNTEAKPGGTETNVLKDHDTNCNGQAMSNFHLSRDGDNISYKYNCESNLGTYENMDKNTELNEYGNTGSLVYLDRHNLDCSAENGFLTQFKYNKEGDKINYNYKCNKDSIKTDTITDHETELNEDGQGNLYYLDRQNIKCPEGKGLVQFKLDRGGTTDKVKYMFKCASPADAPVEETTDTTTDTPPAAEASSGTICFPETAIINNKLITELKIGDTVPTSSGMSKITTFLHYEPDVKVNMIRFVLQNNHTTTVSRDHMIFINGKYKSAIVVNVGDFVEYDGEKVKIVDKFVVETKGLYAPLTEEGNIIVDNVHYSCYTQTKWTQHIDNFQELANSVAQPTSKFLNNLSVIQFYEMARFMDNLFI